jgi:hypothetical protein
MSKELKKVYAIIDEINKKQNLIEKNIDKISESFYKIYKIYDKMDSVVNDILDLNYTNSNNLNDLESLIEIIDEKTN